MRKPLGLITDTQTALIPVAEITVQGKVYIVGTTPTGAPVVRSVESKQDWRLQVEELVTLAREAGIDRAGQEYCR